LGYNILEIFERHLLYERDPVKLWRMAMGLQNHKYKLRRLLLKRFPGQKQKLAYFGAGHDIDQGA
jgi:hypothetical protein